MHMASRGNKGRFVANPERPLHRNPISMVQTPLAKIW